MSASAATRPSRPGTAPSSAGSSHRLQARREGEQRLLRRGVSLGFLPGLALCLLAVAGAAHDASHGSVGTDLNGVVRQISG